jgi:hypothetical protein
VWSATSRDFPEFGGPTSATCAAPDRSTWWVALRRPPPPFFPPPVRMRAIFFLMSAWSFSVPLCLGMVESISRRQASRS